MGDNPESDIAGANAFGIFSILVRTGVFRGKDNHHIHPATTVQPDVLVNNVIVACEESANAAITDGCTMGAEEGELRIRTEARCVWRFCANSDVARLKETLVSFDFTRVPLSSPLNDLRCHVKQLTASCDALARAA